MLSRLIERTWTTTLVWVIFVATLYCYGHSIHSILGQGLFGLSTVYYTQCIVHATTVERKLDKLGKRAPRVKDISPFGLGIICKAIYYLSQHRAHDFWWQMFRESGNASRPYTVEALPACARIIFTADEENIKAILATQFQDYGKGERFRQEWRDFLGLSIFTTDGELWHNARSLLRSQFAKDRLSDLHIFETHVQALLPMLTGSYDGDTVRVDELFFRFSLDAATHFLLGASVDSQIKSAKHGSAFADAFAEVQHVQAIITRAGPMNAFVPRRSFYKSLDIVNEFVNKYIDKALQLPKDELEKITKSDEGYTFLHALASYTRDRQVLRDQIVAVLLAGRDTTAVTLSWLFYEISKNEKIVRKLREEIGNFVGFNRSPTYSDLKSMKYLQHTLNETLRLYPVVPYNVRVALQDTTLPHGGGPDGNEPIGVVKDTPIGYSTLILQRRQDIYPTISEEFANPTTFAPERWDHWTPKTWTYVPFNGGPRICIGQQFALTEMAYTVVRILQTYERVACRSYEFPGYRTDIVLQPAAGVKVAFHQKHE